VQVDRKIVLANRYWDPLDLERLFTIYAHSGDKFPTNVFARDLSRTLFQWTLLMQKEFSFYFNRYLTGGLNEKYLFGVAISAESWAREVPLSQILIRRFGLTGDELDDQIDAEIEKLTRYVSFGLPMLLKPLADMQDQDSNIISAIELGVYSPISKYLSDRGVPRETAIKVGALHKKGHTGKQAESIDVSLVQKQLNFWELQHLEHVI
jgi:hypothetical protein